MIPILKQKSTSRALMKFFWLSNYWLPSTCMLLQLLSAVLLISVFEGQMVYMYVLRKFVSNTSFTKFCLNENFC